MKKKLNTLLIMLMTLTLAQAQTVDEVIEKHIEALGGKEKLSQLKSARIEAVVTVSSFEVKSTSIVLQNQGIWSEQEIQGMKIVQAFDGTTAWMINPMMGGNKATKLPAEQNAAMKSQMDLTGLYNYKGKGYNVSLKGEEELNGTPVFVLSVQMPDGNHADNYISKSNYLTLKTTVKIKMPEDKTVETSIYSSDYKKVDGYVTPYQIEIEGGGLPGKVTTKVTNASFNVAVDPKLFAFPAE